MAIPYLFLEWTYLPRLFIIINIFILHSYARSEPFVRWYRPSRRDSTSVTQQQFLIPADNGGAQLTSVFNTGGLGEPINVIISATSDKQLLVDSKDNGGLQNYFLSIGFAGECLGQHIGDHQQANLGDGKGPLNETAVMRWDYGDPNLGTCKETFDGGNHFRYWIQNTTGAIFMATGYEDTAAEGHGIVPNGYDLGRDQLVGNATNQTSTPPTRTWALPATAANFSSNENLTTTFIFSETTVTTVIPTTTNILVTFPAAPTPTKPVAAIATFLPTFTGMTFANNYTYQTTSQYLTGLLPNSSQGINHGSSVGNASTGSSACDGLVVLLEVTIVAGPGIKKNTARTTMSTSNLQYSLMIMILYACQTLLL